MNAPAAIEKSVGLALAPVSNRAEMQLPEDPFLLAKFEEFYLEVVRLKTDLARPASDSSSSTASSQQTYNSLLVLLIQQKAQVDRAETLLGIEMYRQAQHVMACLADEIFSALYHTRSATWTSLEAELFGESQPGGFSLGGPCLRKLDLLLLQGDPVYRELASVYFYALVLREPGNAATSKYLGPLCRMIADSEDGSAEAASPLFAQSYAHTLSGNKTISLPSVRKWLLAFVFIFLAWIFLSSHLWTLLSVPIEEQLRQIQRLL